MAFTGRDDSDFGGAEGGGLGAAGSSSETLGARSSSSRDNKGAVAGLAVLPAPPARRQALPESRASASLHPDPTFLPRSSHGANAHPSSSSTQTQRPPAMVMGTTNNHSTSLPSSIAESVASGLVQLPLSTSSSSAAAAAAPLPAPPTVPLVHHHQMELLQAFAAQQQAGVGERGHLQRGQDLKHGAGVLQLPSREPARAADGQLASYGGITMGDGTNMQASQAAFLQLPNVIAVVGDSSTSAPPPGAFFSHLPADASRKQTQAAPNKDNHAAEREAPTGKGGGVYPKRHSNGRSGKRNISGEIVDVLRAWFEEHEDWPYPNDSEQAELSVKTGVSPKVVNTWFINARKRRKSSEQGGAKPGGGRKAKAQKQGEGSVAASGEVALPGVAGGGSLPSAGVQGVKMPKTVGGTVVSKQESTSREKSNVAGGGGGGEGEGKGGGGGGGGGGRAGGGAGEAAAPVGDVVLAPPVDAAGSPATQHREAGERRRQDTPEYDEGVGSHRGAESQEETPS